MGDRTMSSAPAPAPPRGVLRRARVAAIMAGARRVRAREPADPHARPRRRTHFRSDRRMPVSENLATPKLPPVDPLPLTGLRVLDLTLARAGPTCVRHLADWGADVIRVRAARRAREASAPATGSTSRTCTATSAASPRPEGSADGHAAFLKLVSAADVVVENMRAPGEAPAEGRLRDLQAVKSAARLRLDLAASARTARTSKRAGVDQIAQGMGGLMSITGEPGRGPMRVGIPIADLTAGNLLALGVMMALFERQTTGEGRWVHTACWRRRSSCSTSRPAAG